MMFRPIARSSAATPLPARHPNDIGDLARPRPRPDRLASLLRGERAGEVRLETLMRVL